MSGWTVLTVRGRQAKDYDYTREESSDRWDATADIVATMADDDRVRRWTTWSGHVYAYLNTSRYSWEFAEELLGEYGEMVDDAVVLGANDTSDTGCARYYPRPDIGRWTDQYEEDQGQDGYYVGELALCVINARHGIVARDPFHNESGLLDDRYEERGQTRTLQSNTGRDEEDILADGGFHSGDHHVLYDDHAEPEPSLEDLCTEGGCTETGHHRCGCCGMKLCGRHHEVQGGFCSNFERVAGVPGCLVWENEIHVYRRAFYDSDVEVLEFNGTFCLEEDGEPVCGSDQDDLERRELQELDREYGLCVECEEIAVDRLTDDANGGDQA